MRYFRRFFLIIFLLAVFVNTVNFQVFSESIPIVTQIATVSASSLRLRSGPSTGHTAIAAAPRGDYVMINGQSGSWYRVSYNLKQGYMHESYLKTYYAKNVELGYGRITANNVNLRSGPGTSYRSVAKASVDEKAYIIGFNQQWYKVIYADLICYVRSDYLVLTETPYENNGSSNDPIFFKDGKSTGVAPSAEALKTSGEKSIRNQIITEARKYVGVPYLWGGTNSDGFDCSGYVQYVLKQCGISIPRTTEQQVMQGMYISKSQLQPGDLVFLQNTYRAGVSHVGIYLGNNQMIHSSSSKGVTVSDLTSSYYTEHYHSARKLLI